MRRWGDLADVSVEMKSKQEIPQNYRFPSMLFPALALGAAVTSAIFLYVQFMNSPRLLWNDAIHDRNSHLYAGLCLAMDVRIGDFGHLLPDLDSFRTWPPLHGLLAGLCLWLGGEDERWAVIPSLIGWVGSALFAFLLARRMSPRNGSIAGLLAALFVLVSPAHRLYATDVMLESLGACLTLACLYFYVAATQEQTPTAFRRLASALTLLFFHKYNYWLLIAIGLSADHICSNRNTFVPWIKNRLKGWSRRAWFIRQIRHPLTYLILPLLVLIAAISLTGGTDVNLFGNRVEVRSSANLVTIAYVLFLIRLAPWYWRAGRASMRSFDARVRMMISWHVWPVAIWFLWPHRLYSFLWTTSPASNGGEFPKHDLLGGYSFYWASMAQDYHMGPMSALLVIGFLLVAAWAGYRGHLRPGATGLLWFVGIAFLLTVHHPNRKSRFLHSWIPAVWVGAGVGAGVLTPVWRGRKYTVGAVCYSAAVGALAVSHLPGLAAPARAVVGEIHRSGRSILDVTDAYLPDLADCRRAAVFSNLPMKSLTQWTYLKRYRRAQRLDTDIKGFDPLASDNQSCFDRWVAATECDTILYVEFAPGTTFHAFVPNCENLSQYGKMMKSQTRFSFVRYRTLPEHGCTVTVWKRGIE